MAIIIGSTGGLGRALAEEAARRGYDLTLHGRTRADLLALASDLRFRFGTKVDVILGDYSKGYENYPELELENSTAPVLLLIPMGLVLEGDSGQLSPAELQKLIEVNFSAIVHLVHKILPTMEKNGGQIVGFGSIAGARGRSHNMVYSASKRALQSFFESMMHKYDRSDIKLQYYICGYLRTRNTDHLNLSLPMAEPTILAKAVFENLSKNARIFTFPKFWAPIIWVIKGLPWFFFRRLKF